MDECKPLLHGVRGGDRLPAGRHRQDGGIVRGRAVQVDAMKPTLKAPGTKRLKLYYDEPPSNSAFKFNLHRYSVGQQSCDLANFGTTFGGTKTCSDGSTVTLTAAARCQPTAGQSAMWEQAGAHTRPLFGST